MTKSIGGMDRVRDCKCGTGCGLTYTFRERGHNARYAAGCPSPGAKKAEQTRRQSWKSLARKTGFEKPRYNGGERKGLRPKQNICLVCYDLPHARPPEGCTKCKLPHGEAPVSRDDTRGFSSAALAIERPTRVR